MMEEKNGMKQEEIKQEEVKKVVSKRKKIFSQSHLWDNHSWLRLSSSGSKG